ncbi:MAG: winged helix-turn-helix domain-containing protein, partial [Anaerolineales bacterium]|nr:winged helix-turn-helix domain-containing protein [Anaerolineales bacterium]
CRDQRPHAEWPDELHASAPTSAIYFCQPSRPETLDPRSFALTIASQWASRDSHFANLQSTIDSHESYELDELVEQLLIRPFTDIDELIYPASIVFLVDDLEAALQHPGETTIVDVILRMLREVHGVRFLLTAQMQPEVRRKMADVEKLIYELPPTFRAIFNFAPTINAMPNALPGFSELLLEIESWLTNPEAPQHGGIFPESYCGKSAAAANLIKLSQGSWAVPPELTTRLTAVRPGFIAAYHFYQSTDPRTKNPRHFIQSVAAQLANRFPAYNEAVRETIDRWQKQQAAQKVQTSLRLDDDLPGENHPYLSVVNQMSVVDAFDRLIVQPWMNFEQAEPILILVDGLEDMLTYEGATTIPALLAQASLPAFLRFFLAANEDPTINSIFSSMPIKNFFWQQFVEQQQTGTPPLGSEFVADFTLPDESAVRPKQLFTKTWRLRNRGANWSDGFSLAFVEGVPMTATLSQPVPNTPPGEEVNISISLTAPAQAGHHLSVWQMCTADGIFFGDHVWVKIVVDENAPAAGETAVSGYDNFDIQVGQPLPGPDQRYPIVVTSETSGQLQDIEQTFAPVTELGYERLARLRDLASSPEDTLEIGQRLFSVLMREPNYEMVRRSLEAARSRGKAGLRLRLQLDDPSLQAYPWELCHDGRSYIFNNPDQPILLQRTIGVENVQAPPPLPRPVRLLVAIAAPVDQGRADVALQEKVIHLATEEVVTSSELDVQIIRHTTLRDLENAVQSYQPHIVQFIGHSRSEKDGVFILENKSGRSNLVPVPELTRLLAAAPVQCVILSPIGVGENSLTQLAPQFIQQGIPTVLAEQFVLPDQPATAFWRTFYRTLLFDRLSFEEGVWNGRNHLATAYREPFLCHMVFFNGQIVPYSNNDRTPAFWIDAKNNTVWIEGKPTNLTTQETIILSYLNQKVNQVCTYDEILSEALNVPTSIATDPDELNRLHTAVTRLRSKIELDVKKPRYLKTIRSRGYTLVMEENL